MLRNLPEFDGVCKRINVNAIMIYNNRNKLYKNKNVAEICARRNSLDFGIADYWYVDQ